MTSTWRKMPQATFLVLVRGGAIALGSGLTRALAPSGCVSYGVLPAGEGPAAAQA